MREMGEYETEVLFEHTKRLRTFSMKRTHSEILALASSAESHVCPDCAQSFSDSETLARHTRNSETCRARASSQGGDDHAGYGSGNDQIDEDSEFEPDSESAAPTDSAGFSAGYLNTKMWKGLDARQLYKPADELIPGSSARRG